MITKFTFRHAAIRLAERQFKRTRALDSWVSGICLAAAEKLKTY